MAVTKTPARLRRARAADRPHPKSARLRRLPWASEPKGSPPRKGQGSRMRSSRPPRGRRLSPVLWSPATGTSGDRLFRCHAGRFRGGSSRAPRSTAGCGLDGVRRGLLADLRTGPQRRRHAGLEAMLLVEKGAHRSASRGAPCEIEIAPIDRMGAMGKRGPEARNSDR